MHKVLQLMSTIISNQPIANLAIFAYGKKANAFNVFLVGELA